MKSYPRLSNLFPALLVALCLAAVPARAQTAETFVAQITSVPNANVFVADISGDGRFVVMESNGNFATENPRNADGNYEIFLFDYAQRRVFQLTDTRRALVDSAGSSTDPANIEVDILNLEPSISRDGHVIVFKSNAFNSVGYNSNPGAAAGNGYLPRNFDAGRSDNRGVVKDDGNMEIFVYELPTFAPVDISNGTLPATRVELAGGTFRVITDTPASVKPSRGGASVSPQVAHDNRTPSLDDDGSVLAFLSTRNLPGASNTDANGEVYLFNRATGLYTQVTNTTTTVPFINEPFNANPTLSGDGSAVVFTSSANIPDVGSSTGNNADGNAEIYLANYNGGGITSIRQVTRTIRANSGDVVNILSVGGRRLSQNGNFIAFESRANPSQVNGALQPKFAVFLYNVSANTFTQVGTRSATTDDVLRFPTFTGDNATLVFSSTLNFNADGTLAAAPAGLNPQGRTQLWAVPTSSPQSFARMTNTPAPLTPSTPLLAAAASNTRERFAFGIANTDYGDGNPDGSYEVFYLLTPTVTSATNNSFTLLTAPSLRFVVGDTAVAPAPQSPVAAVAPGMLVNARSSQTFVASNLVFRAVPEGRRPQLPVELNGVRVAVNGVLTGLYFVSPHDIRFVVPPNLPVGTSASVVINNNGAVMRGSVQLTRAQPDVATQTEGPGGVAVTLNITSPFAPLAGPVRVVSTDENGQQVATVLRLVLTGMRNVSQSAVEVRIGNTSLTGASILYAGASDTPGFDQIDVRLPSSLAGAGTVPVVVNLNDNGTVVSSRPAASAPTVTILP